MSRLRRAVAALIIALAAAVTMPSVAAAVTMPSVAATTELSSIPWLPYRTAPFTDAPGAVCTFGVTGNPVKDQEQYRTLSSYSDGSPQLQEFRGPLYVRYTNQSTGASVIRNLSGYGFFYYSSAGGIDALILSHIGVTIPVGNVGHRPGEWIFTGQSEIIIGAGGNITVHLINATAEDMCTTLA